MLAREDPSVNLLLISNSTLYGSGYLDHAAPEIQEFLGSCRTCLFIPYAMFDRDGYAETARIRFEAMGRRLGSVHRCADRQQAVESAEAFFVGGGNTFRLLEALHRHDLLAPIRRRVRQGVPFVGSSAGSIVACPTIRTTKDMPILEPPTLAALGLVSFQISPHYLDPDPGSTHMGETQEERIGQFHEENEAPVIGLREGGIVSVKAGATILKGRTRARIFRRGHPPVEVAPGTRLDHA